MNIFYLCKIEIARERGDIVAFIVDKYFKFPSVTDYYGDL